MFFKRISACRGILCLLTAVIFSNAKAQQPLSLSDVVNAALKYQPLLNSKQALINTGKAELIAARHDFLPRLRVSEQLNAGTDNSLAGSYFSFGITPSSSAGIRAGNNSETESGNMAVLYGEYQLCNFGLRKAKLNDAKANISLQTADLEKEKYLLALQTARYYFSILKSQYRLDAERKNVSRYDSIFMVIRALSSAGIRPGSDSSLAKAELSKAKVNYNQTLGNLLQLKEELSYLTGIAPELVNPDTAAIDPLFISRKYDTTANASGVPLINYYISRKNTLLAREQLIRKSFLPKILLAASAWGRGSSIQYSDNYKSLAYGWGYQRFNYLAGVAFSYDLFNGIFRKDQLRINGFQLQASEYDLQQQRLGVELASRKADYSLQTAFDNYHEIPVQLRSSEDTYRQKLAQYKAGLISLIDLTNASFVLYRAQVDYSETLTELLRAKLDKAAATGNLYSFIQSFK